MQGSLEASPQHQEAGCGSSDLPSKWHARDRGSSVQHPTAHHPGLPPGTVIISLLICHGLYAPTLTGQSDCW